MKVQYTKINADIRRVIDAVKGCTRLNSGESLKNMSQKSLKEEWGRWLTAINYNNFYSFIIYS
jgi:hypothetical protein